MGTARAMLRAMDKEVLPTITIVVVASVVVVPRQTLPAHRRHHQLHRALAKRPEMAMPVAPSRRSEGLSPAFGVRSRKDALMLYLQGRSRNRALSRVATEGGRRAEMLMSYSHTEHIVDSFFVKSQPLCYNRGESRSLEPSCALASSCSVDYSATPCPVQVDRRRLRTPSSQTQEAMVDS